MTFSAVGGRRCALRLSSGQAFLPYGAAELRTTKMRTVKPEVRKVFSRTLRRGPQIEPATLRRVWDSHRIDTGRGGLHSALQRARSARLEGNRRDQVPLAAIRQGRHGSPLPFSCRNTAGYPDLRAVPVDPDAARRLLGGDLVRHKWSPARAAQRSPSLARARLRLSELAHRLHQS